MAASPTPSSGPKPKDPLGDPAQFLALGLQLAASRAGGLALALVERALERHGDDPLWQAAANAIRQSDVPDFHVRMLRDDLRNAAYRAAIARFAPGRSVLDIGTGSGLLAMMAARAGARQVYACEANPMLAASARTVIAANGLADRIRVFDCHSGKLDRNRDLDGGVDLVVSEVFCHTLIGEGVLGSLAHARADLTRPGALFLPAHASIEVALAEIPPLLESVGPVEGFDLGGFAGHLYTARHCPAEDPALALRSAQTSLFAFDFAAGDPAPSGTAQVTLTSTGGTVSGLAQWLRLTFADDIIYENRPGSADDLHWRIGLAPTAPRETPCETSCETGPGARYLAGGTYAADTLALWCAPEANPASD
jgi:type II protein arginine methyltransferase